MKRLVIALLSVFLTAGLAMADFIDHPNFARINSFTASLMNAIDDAQAEFFLQNGRYFQGITQPSYPVDGTKDKSVNWNVTANDLNVSWRDFLPNIFRNSFDVPFQISIHVYYDPERGQGYFVILDVWYPGLDPDPYGEYGDHWRYVHHKGAGTGSQWPHHDEWYIVWEPEP